MSRAWLFAHLLLLSAEDVKERQLSMILIAELGIVGAVRLIWTCGRAVWIPGAVLLGLGYISGEKIGYGDGWLMLALGMWLPMESLLYMLWLGLLFCAVFSVLFGRKELPLVPFLTAAYVVGGFL